MGQSSHTHGAYNLVGERETINKEIYKVSQVMMGMKKQTNAWQEDRVAEKDT